MERELARKTKEIFELKQQFDQLQEMLLEVPELKKDLHKSKQEAKGLGEVLFGSRKKTVQLEDLVKKLNKQIKDKEKLSEHCMQLQKSLESITQERDQNGTEVERLRKDLEHKESEVQRNRDHCITLKELVDRLEVRNFKYIFITRVCFCISIVRENCFFLQVKNRNIGSKVDMKVTIS